MAKRQKWSTINPRFPTEDLLRKQMRRSHCHGPAERTVAAVDEQPVDVDVPEEPVELVPVGPVQFKINRLLGLA